MTGIRDDKGITDGITKFHQVPMSTCLKGSQKKCDIRKWPCVPPLKSGHRYGHRLGEVDAPWSRREIDLLAEPTGLGPRQIQTSPEPCESSEACEAWPRPAKPVLCRAIWQLENNSDSTALSVQGLFRVELARITAGYSDKPS